MPTIDDIMRAKAAGTIITGPSATSPSSLAPSLSSLFSNVPGESVPGTDFILIRPRPPYTIALIYGKNGCGKTSIVTGHYNEIGELVGAVPDPFALIDVDNRSYERALEAKEAGKTIYYLPAAYPADIMEMDTEEAKKFATDSLARIKHNYKWAIYQAKQSRDNMRLIALDGVKELGDLISLAYRGRTDRPEPKKGEPFPASIDMLVNRELWYFPNMAREACVNLVMIGRAKEVYKGREGTGAWTWDCNKIFDAACDWSAEIRLTDVEAKLTSATERNGGKPLSPMDIMTISKSGPSFELVVDKAGNNIKEKGRVYTQEDWEREGVGPFAYAATRLMPRTKVEDWS